MSPQNRRLGPCANTNIGKLMENVVFCHGNWTICRHQSDAARVCNGIIGLSVSIKWFVRPLLPSAVCGSWNVLWKKLRTFLEGKPLPCILISINIIEYNLSSIRFGSKYDSHIFAWSWTGSAKLLLEFCSRGLSSPQLIFFYIFPRTFPFPGGTHKLLHVPS